MTRKVGGGSCIIPTWHELETEANSCVDSQVGSCTHRAAWVGLRDSIYRNVVREVQVPLRYRLYGLDEALNELMRAWRI